jgi:TolB-like protein
MNYFIILVFTVFLSACSSQTRYDDYILLKAEQGVHDNLHSAISGISKQLFNTTNKERLVDGVIVTSFVSLRDLKHTTGFGRLLGESMISELHKEAFKVFDFRGQDSIVVNQNGEFYITRDSSKLKDEIQNANILVGTYSLFDKHSVLINVRIVEFETGLVISTARVVYTIKDCNLLDNCTKLSKSSIIEDK